MAKHFEHLIELLNSEEEIYSLVEIGSNDGAFLKLIQSQIECHTVGIDPAINLALASTHLTITDFFNKQTARRAFDLIEGAPSVILARHCVAHMDDLHEFVDALTTLAGHETLIAIEIPYMRDTLQRVEFDQSYHEHLNFINLPALEILLSTTPFHIHRVVHYAVHGGTVLVLLRHHKSRIQPTVSEYVREDKVTLEDWRLFSIKAHQKISHMYDVVASRAMGGKTVCGFGASAKASVWINACGFTEREIRYVTDNSPHKPGCLMPGTNIPVISQSRFMEVAQANYQIKAEYAVLFAWNFRDEVLSSQTEWRSRGGRFIIPTATGVEIV